MAASSGAGPDGPKLFNRHHHIDGRCHMDLFKMLGTLDPDGRCSLNRPVAGRRCRTGALGAVAGTADANACVRGAGGGVCLLPSGCLSLFSAARLPLPWFVRIPCRFREARQNRRSWTVLMQARRTTEAADHFTTAPAAVGCDPRGSPLRRSGRSFRRRLSLGVARREPVLSADARPNPTDTRYRASPSPQLDRMAGWSRTGSLQRPGVGTGQEEKTATPSEVLDQTLRDRLGPAPGRLSGQVKSGHLWTPQNRPFPASRDRS